MARKFTNELIDLVDEGILSAEDVLTACLKYMSEDDVKDMAICNEFLSEDDDE